MTEYTSTVSRLGLRVGDRVSWLGSGIGRRPGARWTGQIAGLGYGVPVRPDVDWCTERGPRLPAAHVVVDLPQHGQTVIHPEGRPLIIPLRDLTPEPEWRAETKTETETETETAPRPPRRPGTRPSPPLTNDPDPDPLNTTPWIPLTVDVRRGTAPPKGPPRVALRTAARGDQGYITSTWLRQMREADRDYVSGGRWGEAGRHVDLVLERPDTRALVVHPTGQPERIIAWAVYAAVPEVPTVHFLYVRAPERERGLAAGLLRQIGVKADHPAVYTCHGPGERLLLRRYRLATHLPLYRFLGQPHKERPVDEKWKTNRREDPHR